LGWCGGAWVELIFIGAVLGYRGGIGGLIAAGGYREGPQL